MIYFIFLCGGKSIFKSKGEDYFSQLAKALYVGRTEDNFSLHLLS